VQWRLVLVAACGGTGGGSASDTPDRSPAEGRAVASAEAQARGPASPEAVDACALLDAAEVEALIGKNGGGRPAGAPGGDGGACAWENPDDSHSVSLDIGRSGTAATGTLPAWDPVLGPERPLGDGMRSLGGGQVEFVADTRDCTVQVVAAISGNADEDKAVELARAVRARL
jgi:hypothetical protein